MNTLVSNFKIRVKSVLLALRNRGLYKTLQLIVMAIIDERNDKKRGLLAHDFLDPKTEYPHHPSSKHANYYQPIRTISFLKLLDHFNFDKNLKFIDIGSGTGKAMILAADYGFSHITGIEFVPELCKIAQLNLEKFSSEFPHSKLNLIDNDFRNVNLENSPTLILLNDPFDNEMMEVFADKITENISQGHTTIIYKNVNLRDMPALKRLETHMKRCEFDHQGNYFEVFLPNKTS